MTTEASRRQSLLAVSLAEEVRAVAEAVRVVRAASAAGIPAAISFTVEIDGRLPTWQPLHEAIEQVDAATGARRPPRPTA